MSAKINASMKRISASLTLIASKVIAGDYDTVEELKAARVNVQNAIATTESAFTVATKPATMGRKGIVAMATAAHDKLFANISEAQIKANLLNEAISADIQEMEENLVEEPTEEIEIEDFSEEGALPQDDDFEEVSDVESMDHEEEEEFLPEVADPVVEEVTEEVVEEAMEDEDIVDELSPEVEVSGEETLDDLIEEEEFETEGTLDSTLAEFTQVSSLDYEEEEVSEVEATLVSSKKKANLKATVVASKASDKGLQALWDFNSNP
jgi:hypothetical protein